MVSHAETMRLLLMSIHSSQTKKLTLLLIKEQKIDQLSSIN